MLKLRVNRGLLALYMCQMLRTKQSDRDFQQNVQVSLGKITGWGKDHNFFFTCNNSWREGRKGVREGRKDKGNKEGS